MAPTLAVIIPATDGPRTLGRCRTAVESAHDPPDEVLVVDVPERSGPAAARNAGALATTADVLVFVDADVAVHPDAFGRIRAAFEADRDLAAVFGSYDDSPDVRGVVANFRNLLHHHVHQSSSEEAHTFWAGLGAVRRDAFEAVGGFDAGEYLVPSMEDVEMGMRLREAGARVRLDHGLLGTHLKEWSLRGMVRTDLVDRGIPWVALLLRRRRHVPSQLNLSWRHRVTAVAVAGEAAALLTRRPRAAGLALLTRLALNRDLYALLWRRHGPLEACAGVWLHAVHHLTALTAVPLGLAVHLRERRRARRPAGAEPRVAAPPDERPAEAAEPALGRTAA